jgi:hypothetical protein
MSLDLNDLLQRYIQLPPDVDANKTTSDFEQVAAQVPHQTLAAGVTETLRSEQTAPFAQLVSQLFVQGNPEQKAAMLNQLIAGLRPELWSSVASGILANLFQRNGGHANLTPEEVNQLSPEQVQEIATCAERESPGIVDKMGEFYAKHSALIKTLGGTAVAIALVRIAQSSPR